MNWSAKHVGLSDTGQVRTANEDKWIADAERGIYMIADGMGGTSNGGLAAQLVVETLPQLIDQRLAGLAEETAENLIEEIGQSIADLSRRLRTESRGESGLDGMGSTVVVAVLRPPFVVVAHLGDSRAYWMKNGQLTRCTSDHTLVQLLIESGEIDDNQSAQHPARGQLTRFVGMPSEAIPDVQVFELAVDDTLLLCSDGLTGELGDTDIERILGIPQTSLDQKCRNLVSTANASGGRDNVTALLIQVSQPTNQGGVQTIVVDSPKQTSSAHPVHDRNNQST